MKDNSKFSPSLLLVFMYLCFFSCKQQMKFDKSGWNESNDPSYPPPMREKMLNDLTVNHKLIGLQYHQLVDTLGDPDIRNGLTIEYRIIEDYGNDIDPIYTKTLQFLISKDSVITSFKINEWKK